MNGILESNLLESNGILESNTQSVTCLLFMIAIKINQKLIRYKQLFDLVLKCSYNQLLSFTIKNFILLKKKNTYLLSYFFSPSSSSTDGRE